MLASHYQSKVGRHTCTVNHPYQAICLLKVVAPVGAQSLLTTHIPDVELVPARAQSMYACSERSKQLFPDRSRIPTVWQEDMQVSLNEVRRSRREQGENTLELPGNKAHPLKVMDLMLNPSVGLIVVMSSPFNRLTMVVLPALSRPLQHG
jgi:hypothetical protein